MSTFQKQHTGLKKSKKNADLILDQEARLTDELLQSALEICFKFGEHTKVETKDFSFHPNDPCLEKVFAQHLKKTKHVPLYSTQKSMSIVGGRMLYTAICCEVGLMPHFNTSGCALWQHGWKDGLRCYHSEKMIPRENVIEMSPSSEAGMTALKDGKGILCSNKWGKQVVKIVQENSFICAEDNNQTRFGQFSSSSCGLNFTDGEKAKTGMKNAVEYTAAVFPKTDMKHLLFIVTACECNYGASVTLGKQIPKMTPFIISGVENLNPSDVDPIKAIAVRYPAVFVFQCCNFQGPKRHTGSKSCEFKISYPDLMFCLITARQLWTEVMQSVMPIQFNTFKWEAALQVKNAILPSANACHDPNPFGDVPPPHKKKRVEIQEISDVSDDGNETE